MDEYFLQFLWRFQKFTSKNLSLVSGESLVVFHPGHQNPDAGPDFLEAKIKIGQIEWSGSVEIHYKSSDWYLHRHEENLAYQNVILHVVWKKDKEVKLNDGSLLPTLEIKDLVLPLLENEYRKYINQPAIIRCADMLPAQSAPKLISMLDQALSDRLLSKSGRVKEIFQASGQNWEETAYRLLTKNFGFSKNSENFFRLAESLPFKVIRKHADQLLQVMSLLFGQAGFLESPPMDDHQHSLKKEFDFLQSKYELTSSLSRFQWKFSKLRPANFPTVRIAQLSVLLSRNRSFFSMLIEDELPEILRTFQIDSDAYWKFHYDFGKPANRPVSLGKSSAEILLINTSVPLLAAYSKYCKEQKYMDKAIAILEHLPSEKNNIISKWNKVGIASGSAFDSQALIHQYQEYCTRKKCLKCAIGMTILNKP